MTYIDTGLNGLGRLRRPRIIKSGQRVLELKENVRQARETPARVIHDVREVGKVARRAEHELRPAIRQAGRIARPALRVAGRVARVGGRVARVGGRVARVGLRPVGAVARAGLHSAGTVARLAMHAVPFAAPIAIGAGVVYGVSKILSARKKHRGFLKRDAERKRVVGVAAAQRAELERMRTPGSPIAPAPVMRADVIREPAVLVATPGMNAAAPASLVSTSPSMRSMVPDVTIPGAVTSMSAPIGGGDSTASSSRTPMTVGPMPGETPENEPSGPRGLAPWILPAAGIGLVGLFMLMRRRKRSR